VEFKFVIVDTHQCRLAGVYHIGKTGTLWIEFLSGPRDGQKGLIGPGALKLLLDAGCVLVKP
jgi:hypothetical protein